MFKPLRKALENWFDTVSDGWSPITVRDLRRAWQSWFIAIATLAHLGFLTFFHIVDLTAHRFSEIFLQIFPTCLIAFFVSFLTIERVLRSRLGDELFDNTPLTPESIVHGHIGTSCVLSTFFLVQAIPFLLFPSMVPYSLPIRLGLLFYIFVAAQVLTLYFLAFFVRTKTPGEVLFTFFIPVCLGGFITLFPMFIMNFITFTVAVGSPGSGLYGLFLGVTLFSRLLMLTSFGVVLYLLAMYHYCDRSTNLWWITLRNLLCFAIWGFFWAFIDFDVFLLFALANLFV